VYDASAESATFRVGVGSSMCGKEDEMRMLLKVRPQGELGNKAILDGTFGRLLGQFGERFHPEAMYFTTEHGERTALLIFNLKTESEMVAAAEPFWNELHATVDWAPVMTAEDVQKGLAALPKR
jgi:hypothetical protein